MSDQKIIYGDGWFMPESMAKGLAEDIRAAERQLMWPDPNFKMPPTKYYCYIRVDGKEELSMHWIKMDAYEIIGDSYEETDKYWPREKVEFIRYAKMMEI